VMSLNQWKNGIHVGVDLCVDYE